MKKIRKKDDLEAGHSGKQVCVRVCVGEVVVVVVEGGC